MATTSSFDPTLATPGPASFTVVPEDDLRKYLDEQGGKVFLVKNEVVGMGVGANAAIALKKNHLHSTAAETRKISILKKGSAACVHCTANFTNADDAVNHHNAESAKRSTASCCCFCAFKANPAAANNCPATADVIRRHIRRAHFGVSVSECPVCDKAILGDLGVVRRHLVAFHGGKRHNTAERLTAEEHECQVCLKVFFVRDRRDEHLKNEHHRCSECGLLCRSKAQLADHGSDHHGKENRKRRFSSTGSPTKRKQTLREHKCGLCKKVMWSAAHLRAHMRLHTNEQVMGKGAVLGCDVCNAEVGTNERLLRHVEREHAYQCPECEEHFAKTADLSWHQQKAHSQYVMDGITTGSPIASPAKMTSALRAQDFPSRCTHCPSSEVVYQTAASYEIHCLYSHPFQCPICPRMLRQPSGIRRHFRTIHPKLKPYFCTSCALVFVSSVMVQSHECSGTLTGQKEDQEEGDKTIEEQLKQVPVARPAESQVLRKEGYEEFVIPPLEVLLTWDIVTQMEPGDAIEEILALIPPAVPKRKKDRRRSKDSRNKGRPLDEEGELVFKCSKCAEAFDVEKDLLQHISESHPYECPDCSRPYTVHDSMRKHCRVTHGHDTISFCRKCVLVFTDPSEGAEHKKRRHGNDRRVSAPRGLPKVAAVEEVSSVGSKEEGYKCLYCREAYERPHSLLKHSRTSHKKGVTTCRQCIRVFKDRATKLLHQKTKEHLDRVEQENNLELGEEEEMEEEEEEEEQPDHQVSADPIVDDPVPMEEEQQGQKQEQGQEQGQERGNEQDQEVELSGAPATNATTSEDDDDDPKDITVEEEKGEVLAAAAKKVVDQEEESGKEESHAVHSECDTTIEDEEKTEEISSVVQKSDKDLNCSTSSALSVLYPCPFCDKSYDKGQSLQKHTRTKHTKTIVYCTLCAAVFRNANAKMEHDCGGSTDMDTDGDEDKEVDCSSISKGNSVEEELSLFLGEASSADVSKEQLNLVLEDSASEDEDNDMSGGDRPAAAETDGKKSNAVARRERCDSPDFHGFESWAEEAEYIKSLEGFRRDLAAFDLDREHGVKPEKE